QTLSAVLTDDPPPIPTETKIPPPLRWIIDRCMAKEPSQRYGATVDLYHDLKNLRDHASEMSVAALASPAAVKKGGFPKWILVSAVSIATLAAGYTFSRVTIPDATDISHHKFTPIATAAVREINPMWSPDGKSIVYSAVVNNTFQLFV